MKIFLLLFITFYAGTSLSAQNFDAVFKPLKKPKHTVSITKKKQRFYSLVLPPVNKVFLMLMERYEYIQESLLNHTNMDEIKRLKAVYGATSDKDLLMRLKPHPRSIALAQAAMESSWGTSRFFHEANNIFGVWSTNAAQKRVAAGKKRGKRTIWLRKFDSLEDAVRQYYYMIATSKAYEEFRRLRYESDDVYKIVEGLVNYSEKKELYVCELRSIIKHNNLTKYDH